MEDGSGIQCDGIHDAPYHRASGQDAPSPVCHISRGSRTAVLVSGIHIRAINHRICCPISGSTCKFGYRRLRVLLTHCFATSFDDNFNCSLLLLYSDMRAKTATPRLSCLIWCCCVFGRWLCLEISAPKLSLNLNCGVVRQYGNERSLHPISRDIMVVGQNAIREKTEILVSVSLLSPVRFIRHQVTFCHVLCCSVCSKESS